MVTHVTYKPHYCDRRYGEHVSDRIYHMNLFGLPRGVPVFSNLLIGRLNAMRLQEDAKFLCNGAFELYPVYYRYPSAKTVTMMKELTFWRFDKMPKYKQDFLKKLFSVNAGIITDTQAMKSLITKHIDVPVEIVNPFCAQPHLDVKPDLDKQNLIFIGSFESPNKGYNELVQAAKQLRGWNIYMVGQRGTDFIKNAPKNVHITNHVPSLKPYLARSSIYVHPAHFEPFGITVLEAMSAGVIPIVTRATGTSEVLEKYNLSNLIIEDNKPQTISEKVQEVHNYSKARKLAISRKCRKIVKSRYLEPRGLEDFRRAFERLV